MERINKNFRAGDYARVVDCSIDKECIGSIGKIRAMDSHHSGVWFVHGKFHYFTQLEPVEDKQEKEEHEHNWELTHTVKEEYPDYSRTGTTAINVIEYAYLLCKCGEVKKKEISYE